MHNIVFITVIVTLCVSLTDTARILICVPCPSISHQVVFHTYIRGLLKRGHVVVFITADPMYPRKEDRPANLTEIDTHDVSYGLWNEERFNLSSATNQGDPEDLYKQIPIIVPLVGTSFVKQMETPEVQELIRNKVHFDVVVVEGISKSAQVLSHVFKAPMILMNSMGALANNHFVMGAPTYPTLLYPTFWAQRLNNLSVFEKIKQIYNSYRIERFEDEYRVTENENVKRLFGPDLPSLEELGNNAALMLLNAYPIFESNRPMPPSVIYIGGIHQRPKKDLPKDLKAYLDPSQKGVVYFSMGTNCKPSTLSKEKVLAIAKALGKLNYDVLIKWDSEHLPGKGNNTKIVTWVPQSDILRHPKIKAFITQGGLQSFDEALLGGVPLVGIPVFADQWFNVEKYVQLNLAVSITEDLTEHNLYNAINKVIDDPSYRQNMIDFQKKIHDQPETALQRAVWWTEHVIRHRGARHLRAPAANMGWSEYLDLPLLATIATIAVLAAVAVLIPLYIIVRSIKRIVDTSVKLKRN